MDVEFMRQYADGGWQVKFRGMRSILNVPPDAGARIVALAAHDVKLRRNGDLYTFEPNDYGSVVPDVLARAREAEKLPRLRPAGVKRVGRHKSSIVYEEVE